MLRTNPNDVSVLMVYAEANLRKGNRLEAMKTYQKLLKIKPDSLETKVALSKIYFSAGQYKGAYSELFGVLEKDPKNIDAHLLLRKLTRATGLPEKDGEAIGNYLDFKASRSRIQVHQKQVGLEIKKIRKLAEDYEKQLEVDSENPVILYLLKKVGDQLALTDESVKDLELMIDEDALDEEFPGITLSRLQLEPMRSASFVPDAKAEMPAAEKPPEETIQEIPAPPEAQSEERLEPMEPMEIMEPSELLEPAEIVEPMKPGEMGGMEFELPSVRLSEDVIRPQEPEFEFEPESKQEQAIFTEEPVPVHQPMSVDEPTLIEEPVSIEEPLPIEESLLLEEPLQVEEQVSFTEQVPVEEPISIEEPVLFEEPPQAEEVEQIIEIKTAAPALSDARVASYNLIKPKILETLEALGKIRGIALSLVFDDSGNILGSSGAEKIEPSNLAEVMLPGLKQLVSGGLEGAGRFTGLSQWALEYGKGLIMLQPLGRGIFVAVLGAGAGVNIGGMKQALDKNVPPMLSVLDELPG